MRLRLTFILVAVVAVLAIPATSGAAILKTESVAVPAPQVTLNAEPEEAGGGEEVEVEETQAEEEAEEAEEEAQALEGQEGEEASPAGSGVSTSSSRKDTHAKCVVPQLDGKSLAAATTALDRAHCKLGKVDRPQGHHTTLVVTDQSDVHGKKLRSGSTVAVRLGPARPQR